MLYRLTMHLQRRLLIVVVAAVAVAAGLVAPALAANHTHRHRTHHNDRGVRDRRSNDGGNTGSATGLGQLSGLLPASQLTLESAIQVNISNETVRLPIYPGTAPVPGNPSQTESVWYILEDASDQGTAKDLGVNYAPKLANIGIGCPACVQTVTEDNPTPQVNPFGPAVIHFAGAPDFSPNSHRGAGSDRVPAQVVPARARCAGPGVQPVHPDRGSPTVYNAPIIATGDGPYDVVHHTNTGDRVLRIHIGRGTRRPASSRSRGPTCCSSRALTPASRSSTSAPTPGNRSRPSWSARRTFRRSTTRRSTAATTSSARRGSGCSASSTARPARQPERPGIPAPRSRRLCRRRRLARQHGDDRRAAPRRGSAQRVRGLPDAYRPPARRRLQPAVGRAARPVDTKGDQGRPRHPSDRRGPGVQPRGHPARPADRRRPGHRCSQYHTARSVSTSTARSSAGRAATHRRQTSRSPLRARSSRRADSANRRGDRGSPRRSRSPPLHGTHTFEATPPA